MIVLRRAAPDDVPFLSLIPHRNDDRGDIGMQPFRGRSETPAARTLADARRMNT